MESRGINFNQSVDVVTVNSVCLWSLGAQLVAGWVGSGRNKQPDNEIKISFNFDLKIFSSRGEMDRLLKWVHQAYGALRCRRHYQIH